MEAVSVLESQAPQKCFHGAALGSRPPACTENVIGATYGTRRCTCWALRAVQHLTPRPTRPHRRRHAGERALGSALTGAISPDPTVWPPNHASHCVYVAWTARKDSIPWLHVTFFHLFFPFPPFSWLFLIQLYPLNCMHLFKLPKILFFCTRVSINKHRHGLCTCL